MLPLSVGKWSLISNQQRLVKTGERLIEQARYYWLLLAQSTDPAVFRGYMARHMETLSAPAG